MADETPRCSGLEVFPRFITDRFTAIDLVIGHFMAGVILTTGVATFGSGDGSAIGFAVIVALGIALMILFARANAYLGEETITGDIDG